MITPEQSLTIETVSLEEAECLVRALAPLETSCAHVDEVWRIEVRSRDDYGRFVARVLRTVEDCLTDHGLGPVGIAVDQSRYILHARA